MAESIWFSLSFSLEADIAFFFYFFIFLILPSKWENKKCDREKQHGRSSAWVLSMCQSYSHLNVHRPMCSNCSFGCTDQPSFAPWASLVLLQSTVDLDVALLDFS